MKLLRAEGYVTVPWRNGGGTTREIAACRDPQRHDDFLWRLSIATVAQSGPFSRFEGVERSIAVLSGEGMRLRTPAEHVDLGATAPPFRFDGEAEIACELLAGATVDLNVMTRRAFFRHRLRRAYVTGRMTITGVADQTLVVANAHLDIGGRDGESLRPLDAVTEISAGTLLELHAGGGGEILVVELMSSEPVPGGRSGAALG